MLAKRMSVWMLPCGRGGSGGWRQQKTEPVTEEKTGRLSGGDFADGGVSGSEAHPMDYPPSGGDDYGDRPCC